MITFSMTTALVILLGVLVPLALLILIVQIRNNSRLHDLTFPVYDHVVKQAEEKASTILEAARDKGVTILENAEEHAAEIEETAEHNAKIRLEEEKQSTEAIHAAYESRLNELIEKNASLLEEYNKRLEGQYAHLETAIQEQEKKSAEFITESSKVLNERIEESQKQLHDKLSSEMSRQLDGAFDEVEKAINEYRIQHLRLIDDQIISLVEQTTAIVLRKTLPMRDHSEFIYQALEEVKKKGLFS